MPENIIENSELEMEEVIEKLHSRLNKLRTGRANPAILDNLLVEYYNVDTPLKQLAVVSVPEARQLVIKPFDKNCLDAIEKAIMTSSIELTPNNNGEVIRLNFPQVTEDGRKKLVKEVKTIAEQAKVEVRNVRRRANDALKKLSLTDDDEKGYIEDVQDLTNNFVKKIEQVCNDKEKELMTV